MDELAAAAAVVAMAVDDYAEADFEQRTLCGDDDGRDGCGLAVEDTEADKEINGGDAASGDIEDVKGEAPVEMLLEKADGMFPEGKGATKAFARDGPAAAMTNELLEIGTIAIDKLWKQRGYDPKMPEQIKAKLGYALDQYEAAAYLITGVMHAPLLSQPEAWIIGKRIQNVIGQTGTIGKKLKALRKRGKCTAPQVAALLHAMAPLNLELPARNPAPKRPRPPSPPPPPPPSPPTATRTAAQAVELALQAPTLEMAQACEYAYLVEEALRNSDSWEQIPTKPDDPELEQYHFEAQEVERTTLRYRHILQTLWRACPVLEMLDVTPAQLTAGMQASDSNSQPCSCGNGLRLAFSPWVLHRPAWGFCSRFMCDEAML